MPRIPRIPLLTHNEALRQRTLLAHPRASCAAAASRRRRCRTASVDVTPPSCATRATASIRKAVDEGARWPRPSPCPASGPARLADAAAHHASSRRSQRPRPRHRLPRRRCPTSSARRRTPRPSQRRRVGARHARPARPTADDTGPGGLGQRRRTPRPPRREIVLRAREAVAGVPGETRQALDDGTNGFERILPGADRMYPDTDLPPMRIADERLERHPQAVPVRRLGRARPGTASSACRRDLAERLAVSRLAALFEALVKDWEIDAEGRRRGPGPVSLRLKTGLDPPRRPATRRLAPDRRRSAATGELSREGVFAADGEGRPRRGPARRRRRPSGDRGGGLRPGRRCGRRARRDEGPQPGRARPTS